jgi:glucose-1-phosphate thymidylyltransferase
MAGTLKKGIILAGGRGSRLYPATGAVSKQLLTVYDKPMIYYPLGLLMELGLEDILLITNKNEIERFQKMLGDGSRLGISLKYASEETPRGIANAFLIAEKFIGNSNVALILGDNIYCVSEEIKSAAGQFVSGGMVFGVNVSDPSEYGVAEVDRYGQVLSIEEKPSYPKSNLAVTGLYLYDSSVVEIARQLKPSIRGELEITDVNKTYLKQRNLQLVTLGDCSIWFDAGTAQSMLNASNYISAVESSSGRKIGCIEHIAFSQGFITAAQLKSLVDEMPNTEYKAYLESLLPAAE